MKRLLRASLRFLAVVALLAAYLFWYLFPALGRVNRLRRAAADAEGQAKREIRLVHLVEPLAAGERRLMEEMQGRVRRALPEIETEEAQAALLDAAAGFLKSSAAAGGWGAVEVAPGSGTPPAEAGFDGMDGVNLSAVSLDVRGSAPPRQAMEFLLRLTEFPGGRLRLQALEWQAASGGSWSLMLLVFHRRPSFSGLPKTLFSIDADSPLLWKPLAPLPADEPPALTPCPMDAFRRR
jgi:hypothetical protein